MGKTDDLRSLSDHLPEGTSDAWKRLLPVLPPGAYLAGGTALTVHLHHRVSRDLDFFTAESFDPEALADTIAEVGSFLPTLITDGTVNGVLGATKVQFLDATEQRHVRPSLPFAGTHVASVPDLLAMKLKVIADRGELRDYFDLMVIDERTEFDIETGIQLFVERYSPRVPAAAVETIVRGLGYLDDVGPDPSLPVPRDAIVAFWDARARRLRGLR